MKRYLKFVAVLIAAFFVTAVVAIPFYFIPVALLPALANVWVAVSWAATVFFGGFSLRALAGRFLFDKNNKAAVQILGGVKLERDLPAMFTGTGATWPFAKLSASLESLQLETPFGKNVWRRQDVRLTGGMLGRWQIETPNEPIAITFYAPPWVARRAKFQLAALGYLT